MDAYALLVQGDTHLLAGEPALAADFYAKAAELEPSNGNAHFNVGVTFAMQGQHHLGLPHMERGISLMADPSPFIGNVLHTKMRLCDWQGRTPLIEQIESRVLSGQKTCPPFQMLSFCGSLALQRMAANLWVDNPNATLSLSDPDAAFHPRQKLAGEKICVAYFSADFKNHPVLFLTVEMFELHDKSQFEIIIFSNDRAPDGDPHRARLMAVCDQWIDIQTMKDEEVIRLARQMQLDVAVDLTGLTQGGRTNILMARVAPVQLHYLGYPATTSAANMDYMIADTLLVREADQGNYSEKMMYLPHCFQVSDRKRHAPSPTPSRESLGLPHVGFVFCSFCNTYKITPIVFDSWMRVLQAAPSSVLMLYADSEAAQNNLRREAEARGVDARRLVFGARVGMNDYFARYAACDLFLDTLPYNAGTTANDALWMGLPLLTIAGEAMTSRMAASLLHTLDLDDLITTSLQDYEARAIELAMNPERYAAIKQKLYEQRTTSPLFDTLQTTRAIERGYTMALERYWQGLEPDHLYV